MTETIPVGQHALGYAHKFYEKLAERATTETVEDIFGNPQKDVVVFRGKLTDVFSELKIAQPYYVKIRRILMDYNCVTYLQRGTKAYDSVLILNHPPPEEIAPEVLTSAAKSATLGEMARRLRALEDWRETTAGGLNIGEALRNMEVRISKVEETLLTERVNGKSEKG